MSATENEIEAKAKATVADSPSDPQATPIADALARDFLSLGNDFPQTIGDLSGSGSGPVTLNFTGFQQRQSGPIFIPFYSLHNPTIKWGSNASQAVRSPADLEKDADLEKEHRASCPK